MNVRPLHDRIIVRRLEEGEQQIGGIIISDTAKEKPQQGTVIAAGHGKANDDGQRVPLDVKAGDQILFGKYAGQDITLDGEKFEEPMRWIATNAGQEGSIVVQKVREMKDDEGFNALTDTYENLVKAGVIDPAKVVRSALQNASSIASLLLTQVCDLRS
jgi:chaperonin GroES